MRRATMIVLVGCVMLLGAVQQAEARDLGISVDAAMPILIPVGGLGDRASVGIGVLPGVGYQITEMLKVKVTTGYVYQMGKDFFYGYDVTTHVSTIPLLAGAEAVFEGGKFKKTVGVDFGLMHVTKIFSYGGDYGSEGFSEDDFGLVVSAGAAYEVVADMDVGVKVAFWDYDAKYFRETMNVGIVAGVNYCW